MEDDTLDKQNWNRSLLRVHIAKTVTWRYRSKSTSDSDSFREIFETPIRTIKNRPSNRRCLLLGRRRMLLSQLTQSYHSQF